MGPLGELTVIDASWGPAGSIATLMLADGGARVIKVERPGADVDDLARLAWERGKQSIELDVRHAADRETLLGLLAHADVFVESFGYGRAEALGLGYEELKARFPRLIVCSITAYGREGPWREEPGYDCLLAAKLGVMVEQPSAGREGPIFLGHPHIYYGTGFVAAIGILSAVRARHVTGRGQRVDASLFDGLLAQSPMNHWYHPEGHSYVETTAEGKRTGFGRKRLITACFECGDGEFIQIHTGGQGGFKRTMEIFGFGDITQTVTHGSEMALPLNDEELVIARDYIPEAFKLRPRAEWIELFEAQDLAALPVTRPGEVLTDPQVLHANAAMEVQHPTLGTLKQAAPPLIFSKSVPERPTPAPRPGEHDAEIRALAASPVAAAAAGESSQPLKHALQGLRVLDFASFFATPYGAKILSDLGADVIFIEPPGGDQMRPLPNPFEAAQRGKRNLVADLKQPDAVALIHELVKTADVVVHNQRPGKAEKLQIDYATLSKVNPKLVYCYLPGYGSSGPKSHLKSFAPLMSGFTGLLFEGAGAGNAPVRSVEGNEDYYNGLLGAVAVLMGLEHRARTGEGQYIESPQMHSSLFVASHHFLGPRGESINTLPLDHEQTGWKPTYRLYRTSDDWICVAAVGNRAFERLATAMDLPAELVARCGNEAGRRTHANELAAELEDRFGKLTSAQAQERLRANSVPCEIPAREAQMPRLFWEPWFAENGRMYEHPDSPFGPIREIGQYVHLSETPGEAKGPAARLGQHTVEILRELGISDERIADYLERRVVFREAVAK